MALSEYSDIKSKVTEILSKNESGDQVSDDLINSLLTAATGVTELPNAAFTSKYTYIPAANLALKEAHDFVKAMHRFCLVYADKRYNYYDDAKDFYTLHKSMLDHQETLYTQLYKKGSEE